LINDEDANPKAVENQLAEEADKWDTLGWVIFSCLLDPFQLGSAVEYAFYPDVLDILPPFPDKPL
jgi:hypothetical protein